jgi:hypothetical protein
LIWVIKGINSKPRSYRGNTQTNVNVNVISQAKDGLDLEALTELVKKGRSAEDIEKKLNQSGGINNLDLDENGKVDFIKVTEYGNKKGVYGFSFTVDLDNGEEQEVAEIEIEQSGDNAEIVTRGNEQIYGSHHHYHSMHPISTFLLRSYLLSPHPFYMSPFGFGRYPGYYNQFNTVNRNTYTNRTNTYKQNSDTKRLSANSPKSKSKLNNPNRGKVANSGIKKSLVKPTGTQKKFHARSASKTIRSGGFGSNKSATSGSRTSRPVSARGFSTSRSFGGGGK